MTGRGGPRGGERRAWRSGCPGTAFARGGGRAEAPGRSGAREVRHVTERAARRTGTAG